MCGLVERFYEPFVLLKNWCSQQNNITEYNFLRRTKNPKRSGWFLEKKKGGNILLDLGIHDLDLLWWFSNSRIKKVLKIDVGEKRCNLVMRLTNNSRVKLSVGWDLPDSDSEWVVNKVTIASKNNTATYDSRKNMLHFENKKIAIKSPRYPSAYFNEIEHFYKCLAGKEMCKINFTEAVESMLMIDKIKSEQKT